MPWLMNYFQRSYGFTAMDDIRCSVTFFMFLLVVLGISHGDFEDGKLLKLKDTEEKIKSMEGTNNTRRVLFIRLWNKCAVGNFIDRCWRCQKNWSDNRKHLANCVQGFALGTIGGRDENIYTVNDNSDNDVRNPKQGTLRHAVKQQGPLWIIFDRDMVIRLSRNLLMTSDKTIDGRGALVTIANGGGLILKRIRNVIIHNIKIHDIALTTESDGISITSSSNIWIDHVEMFRCADGLIDINHGSTAITISNSQFSHHNKVMLFGSNDNDIEDDRMRVTVAYNRFGEGLGQRMPRVRRGFAHVVNNYYEYGWRVYAIGGSQHRIILSQGNEFDATNRKREVTSRESNQQGSEGWTWRSMDDKMVNYAHFKQSGDPNYRFPVGPETIRPISADEVKRTTRFSGTLECIVGKPC